MAINIKIVATIEDIPVEPWNALAGSNPFMSHAFLSALHASGSAIPKTGWQAQYLTAWRQGCLVGAMPLYLKQHSYGEYVFDWSWAEAYQRHGLQYYPKLLCAVPFTPVSGTRVLADCDAVRDELIRFTLQLARDNGVSSLHCLFPLESEALATQRAGMMLRQSVQFHWRNPGYQDFDAYLADLRHDKRKKVRQERRKVRDADIQFAHLRGPEISEAQWDFFMRCYTQTHREHNSAPYLTRAFFRQIAATMSENILLIIAYRAEQPIASALTFYTPDVLYGRSWGALEYHPGLHFETCYYQAIEFCIENKISVFEGGAQGEHKLARGFLPVTTWSAHWLAHSEFSAAVEDFLQRETAGVAQYLKELNDSNPFKTDRYLDEALIPFLNQK